MTERESRPARAGAGGFTRREFVRTSAALAAAGAVPASLLASAAHVAGEDKIRVGLIGCGARGGGAAVNALLADPGVVLWSMGDVFADRIESKHADLTAALAEMEDHGESGLLERLQVAQERRFVGFDAYQRVIDSGVDVVLLTTPPAFRPVQLRAAVEAGRHVFCEKPMAVDGPGVRSVLESARRAKARGLSLVSGFCWRYHLPERTTYARIHEGAIGDVRSVSSTYNTSGWVTPKPRRPEWSDMEFQLRNWHYFHWLSGDHITEQACHMIDHISWALADRTPVRCRAVGGRQVRPDVPETGNVYDHFAVSFEYEGGVRADHMCRHFPNTPGENRCHVLGAEGVCEIDVWAPRHEITGRDTWRYSGEQNDMYQTEHDELFASIRSGRPINDGEWMSHSTLMSIMARQAAYTGQWVTWEAMLNSEESLVPQTLAMDAEPPHHAVATPGQTPLI